MNARYDTLGDANVAQLIPTLKALPPHRDSAANSIDPSLLTIQILIELEPDCEGVRRVIGVADLNAPLIERFAVSMSPRFCNPLAAASSRAPVTR